MTATTPSTESQTYLPSGLPAPMPANDGLDTEFWAAVKRHELVVQRCNACQTFQWGPEWVCHHCHSFDMGWAQVSGRGRIYSWERPWHPVHPALVGQGPYLVVLVELPDIADYAPVLFDPDDADSVPSPPLNKATDWVHVELDLGDGLKDGTRMGPMANPRRPQAIEAR